MTIKLSTDGYRLVGQPAADGGALRQSCSASQPPPAGRQASHDACQHQPTLGVRPGNNTLRMDARRRPSRSAVRSRAVATGPAPAGITGARHLSCRRSLADRDPR